MSGLSSIHRESLTFLAQGACVRLLHNALQTDRVATSGVSYESVRTFVRAITATLQLTLLH